MAKVKGLWNYLMPFATDSTGVCSLFCDADAVVIGMDPGATAVRCYPFTERRKDQRARYKGIHIGEIDAAMGKLDESVGRLKLLIDEEEAGQIVLVGTPVASLTGVDLKALARRLEKASGRRVMGFSTTGNRYYDEGLSDAFRTIYERIRKEERSDELSAEGKTESLQGERSYRTVNLLGFNTLDYPGEWERQKILEHIEDHQMRIGSIWGIRSGFSEWKRALQADLNIVCSASALRLAEKMEKEGKIPFILLDELLEQTGGLELLASGLQIPEHPERILIIGEQIRSGSLRKYIRSRCLETEGRAPEIVNAGFFLTHKKLMEEMDRKLKSEEELITLLTRDPFDLVIGDPLFRLLANPGQNYIMQNHPPVSGGFADQFMNS